MGKWGVWRGAGNVFETCRVLRGTIVLVSRWHYKHRCFDLPHTGYLISLGAAPRCFHGLNLSSSCLFSCLARKNNILYMYITLWLKWFSVCFNWLITWTVHIWVFLNLLFDHVASLHLYALAVMCDCFSSRRRWRQSFVRTRCPSVRMTRLAASFLTAPGAAAP